MDLAASDYTCPQCGAVVVPPTQGDPTRCPACGSILVLCAGIPVRKLVERPDISERDAEQALRAWLGRAPFPSNVAREARIQVGPMAFFPFLRARTVSGDRMAPLAPMPLPEVGELADVPAVLVDDGLSAAEGGNDGIDIDPMKLQEEASRALNEPGCRVVQIERRAYFPVVYGVGEQRFTAVVSAGQGTVCPGRLLPAGRGLSELPVFLVTAGLLFAEALFVPGLVGRLAAVVVTAAILFPVLQWAVARRG